MKKILCITILLSLLFFIGCEDDGYVAPDNLSDISWYTSISPGNPYAINIGEHISFMDVSQGALTHEWTIEEGNYYLSPEFTKSDSLPLFIIEDAPLTTTETTIHVLFNKPGKNTVRLYNTFKDSVSYNGKIPFGAVRKGDVWVIDTVMIVDVYDVINPAVNIYQDGVLVGSLTEHQDPQKEDQATWDTIYVEAGSSLTYVDMTKVGRPDTRSWYLGGAQFSESKQTDSVAVVHYYDLGNYTGNINSIREDKGGMPSARTNKRIPYIIKVIQSSQPLEVVEGTMSRTDNTTISFSVTGELVPFVNEENNFTVSVKNEAADFDGTIAVTSARVNKDDATKIDLTLAAPIYNTDEVMVDYVGGNIKTVDERVLKAFDVSHEVVMSVGDNLLDAEWAGFEKGRDNWRSANCYGWWVGNNNGSEAKPIFTRVDGDDSPSGDAVMRYHVEGGVDELRLQGTDFKGMLSDEGSYTYMISKKIYIEPGSNLSTLTVEIDEPSTSIEFDISNVSEGEWVAIKEVVRFPSLPDLKYNFRFYPAVNPDAGDTVTIYIDDISFILLEERP